jgi:hypothetical protein
MAPSRCGTRSVREPREPSTDPGGRSDTGTRTRAMDVVDLRSQPSFARRRVASAYHRCRSRSRAFGMRPDARRQHPEGIRPGRRMAVDLEIGRPATVYGGLGRGASRTLPRRRGARQLGSGRFPRPFGTESRKLEHRPGQQKARNLLRLRPISVTGMRNYLNLLLIA